MPKAIAGLVLLAIIVALGVAVWLYTSRPKLPAGPVAMAHDDAQSFIQIERGRYLTTVADCAACHTDPHGGKPFAGGRLIETPFGVVAAPNITPDVETGIGTWTNQDFANALQRGFDRGGHMLYPAMPFPYFTKASPADVDAIHAYLRTTAPVRQVAVTDRLPFPFNIRLGMRAWDALYFTSGPFRPDPAKDAEWNRGAYLASSLQHCGACHTPKTALGGDEDAKRFQGYTIQGWYAPNITDDNRRGVGSWSTAEIVAYLQTGHNKQAAASGPMAEEISHSSSRMSLSDVKAIAVYLKSLPGQNDNEAPVDANDPMMKAGKAIYDDSCASCHKADGAGVPGLFPTLKASPSVQSRGATSLMRVVLDGAKSVSTDKAPTGAAMPSYGWQLADDQVGAVLTYVRNAWGNQASVVTKHEVAAMRAELRLRPN